jgi:hypothetical protein
VDHSKGKTGQATRGGSIWALRVAWQMAGLMQEPSQLATRGTCVPEAKTRSAGWLLIVAVASRVAEMNVGVGCVEIY